MSQTKEKTHKTVKYLLTASTRIPLRSALLHLLASRLISPDASTSTGFSVSISELCKKDVENYFLATIMISPTQDRARTNKSTMALRALLIPVLLSSLCWRSPPRLLRWESDTQYHLKYSTWQAAPQQKLSSVPWEGCALGKVRQLLLPQRPDRLLPKPNDK